MREDGQERKEEKYKGTREESSLFLRPLYAALVPGTSGKTE